MRLKSNLFCLLLFFGIVVVRAQVTVLPGSVSYTSVNAAFAAINAGSHTGNILIEIASNTTEPSTPVPLAASGVGAASYSSVTIYPTGNGVVVAGTTVASRAVLEFNGADNVTINGNKFNGAGTARDLTIRNLTAATNIHAVLWFQGSATSPQLGCTNITVKNTILYGNADVSPTRTSATPYQPLLAVAGTTFPTATGTGNEHSNITVDNNEFLRGLVGIHIGRLTTAATGVVITNNEVGSYNTPDIILFKGVYLNNVSGATVSNNHIFEIKSIVAASSTQGIEIAGTASLNCMISRNHIHGIWNTSTGGWASHGIQLNGGNGHTIVNNVIYDLLGSNYASAITTFTPYGIRLSTGTGHKIWYNSIHLYGTVTTGTAASTSAALAIAATTVTGLDIRNNILSNAHVSNVAGFKAYAIRYASGYPFASAGNIVNNNYYGVPAANTPTTSYFVGGTYATGIDYVNLSNLQAATTQDGQSAPPAPNAMPPFTSASNLQIPNGTASLIESGAVPIAALGLPNIDYLGVNRPANGNAAPDMGAYEFNGITPGVTVSLLSIAPAAVPQCTAAARTVQVSVTTGAGSITSVSLNYSVNGVAQTPISMSLISGSTYQGVIPIPTPPNATITWSVTAANSFAFSNTYVGTSYADEPLAGLTVTGTAVASPATFCAGQPTQLIASASTLPSLQTKTLGAGAATSATYSNPFYSLWSNLHSQHIILASELNALGIGAGNLTALGLEITAAGTLPMINLNVKMGHTTATNMNNFVSPPMTTVFTSPSLLPTLGINMMNFSTPFVWDGQSNIVIDFCHDNLTSTATMARTCTGDNLPYVATIKTNRTTATGVPICGDITTNLLTYTFRPRFYIEHSGLPITGITWQQGVTPVGSTNPLTISPLTSGTYSAAFQVFGCPGGSASVTVNPTPIISAPTATNSTQCGIGIPTASVTSTAASGGSGQFFWYDAPTGGNVVQFPPFNPTLNTYYTNDFSTSTLTNASLAGNASIAGGILTLTPSLTNQAGGIYVNAPGYNSNLLQVSFDATNGPAGLADGFSYSYGNDVTAGPEALTAEYGTGNRLKIGFDTYGAGVGAAGIYVFYGPSINSPGQTVGTNGIVGYSNNISWVNTSNTAINISVNASGQLTLTVGGTPIFTNLQLPAAYLSADKSNWAHVVKARSGGIAGGFSIDNLLIQLNQYTTGSTTYLSPISSTQTFYVSEMGTGGCPSLRTMVTATVVPSPALTISGNQTVCNGGIYPLTVTSNVADFDNYIWSPTTGLFTDASATIPYTGTNASTVYLKSTIAGTQLYTLNASNSVTTCANTATVTIITIPATVTTIAANGDHCLSGSTLLTNTPSTGFGTATIAWQSSPDNISFSPIVGANALSYTTPTLTSTTYYRIRVSDALGATCLHSVSDTVRVNNPQLLGTTPASICGVGSLTLGATVSAGATANWYANPTGGAPLFTGTSFTTPVISSTTNYYVSASSGGFSGNVGPASISGSTTVVGTYYVNFTVLAPVTINSVNCYFNTVGAAYTLNIRDAVSLVSVFTSSGTTTVNGTTTPQTLNLNATLTPGTYQMGWTTDPGTYRQSTGGAYPYTLPGVLSITGNTFNDPNYYYYFYNWLVSTGCETPRQMVTATVTPGPAFSITNGATLCNDEVKMLQVTSNVPDFNEYVWTPTTNLFTDAAGTIPYTGAASSTGTVYFRSTTVGNVVYTANAYNTVTTCSGVDTVQLRVNPASVSITADPICVSGTTILKMTGATNFLQWQEDLSGTWTNIGGATSANYTTPTLTANKDYRIRVSNSLGAVCITQPITAVVNNPQLLSTTPGTRCGVGSVQLSATVSAGATANWYTAATGGLPVATGTTFNTPSIAATTTYYVAAGSGGSVSTNTGMPAALATATSGAGTTNFGLVFDVFSAFTLQSVTVYPVSAASSSGTVTVDVISSTGAVLNTATFNVTGSPAASLTPVVLPLNFNILPGTNLKMRPGFTGITGLLFEPSASAPAGNYGYPYVVPGILSINTSTLTAAPTNTPRNDLYYYFYNWVLSTGCESPRVPVVATVTPPPALTISSNTETICQTFSTPVVNITSNLANYDTYSWSPAAGVSGSVASGYTFNPSATTTYTLTASQTGGSLCQSQQTLAVTVNPSPAAPTVTPSSLAICAGSVGQLTAGGSSYSALQTLGTGTTTNSTAAVTPYTSFYESARIQYLVLASELSALGLSAGNITALAFNVQAVGVYGQLGYTVRIGNTTATALSGYVTPTGTTVVFTNPSPTPVLPVLGWNTMTFGTPFYWNGTSNLIVEVCHDNDPTAALGIAYGTSSTVFHTVTAFNSVYGTYNDNALLCGTGVGTLTATSTNRPNMRFTFDSPAVYSWTPVTGLFTNAAGTAPYTGGAATTVYPAPGSTSTYNVVGVGPNGCYANGGTGVTVTVTSPPVADAGNGQAVCGQSPANLSASFGGSATAAVWSGGSGSFSNVLSPTATYTPSPAEIGTTVTLTWTTNATGGCTAAADTVQVQVNAPVAADAGADVSTCATTAVTLGATGTGTWTGLYAGTLSSASAPNAAYTPAVPEVGGTVKLFWTVPDPDGAGPCPAATDSMLVTVNGYPTAVAPPNAAGYLADYGYTDAQSWTHYYDDNGTPANFCDDYLLMSVRDANSGGNSIGSIGGGLQVLVKGAANTIALTAPTTPYVQGGGTWYVMERFWDITPVNQPVNDVAVRFYFTAADYASVAAASPYVSSSPAQMAFYKINNGVGGTPSYNPDPFFQHAGIPPASPMSYAGTGYYEYYNGALADTAHWALGSVGGDYYAEYVINRFSGGGGGGAWASRGRSLSSCWASAATVRHRRISCAGPRHRSLTTSHSPSSARLTM